MELELIGDGLLDLLSRGDVAQDDAGAGAPALNGRHPGQAQFDGEFPARFIDSVKVAGHAAYGDGSPVVHEPLAHGNVQRAHILGHQQIDAGANKLARCIAENLMGFGIGHHDDAASVHHQHRIRGELDDVAVPGFRYLEFGPLAFQFGHGILVFFAESGMHRPFQAGRRDGRNRYRALSRGGLELRRRVRWPLSCLAAIKAEPCRHKKGQAQQRCRHGRFHREIGFAVEFVDPLIKAAVNFVLRLGGRFREGLFGRKIRFAVDQRDSPFPVPRLGGGQGKVFQCGEDIGVALGRFDQGCFIGGKAECGGQAGSTPSRASGLLLPLEGIEVMRIAGDRIAAYRAGEELAAADQAVQFAIAEMQVQQGIPALLAEDEGEHYAQGGKTEEAQQERGNKLAGLQSLFGSLINEACDTLRVPSALADTGWTRCSAIALGGRIGIDRAQLYGHWQN
nr:hypothetical protein [uncultured Thiobacillus sp.]